MKTFLDTPDDIHPADKIGWVQGYNQCLTDHEYMDTHAHLRAMLYEANIALKRCCLVLSGEEMTKNALIEAIETGKKMITEIEALLK